MGGLSYRAHGPCWLNPAGLGTAWQPSCVVPAQHKAWLGRPSGGPCRAGSTRLAPLHAYFYLSSGCIFIAYFKAELVVLMLVAFRCNIWWSNSSTNQPFLTRAEPFYGRGSNSANFYYKKSLSQLTEKVTASKIWSMENVARRWPHISGNCCKS